MPVDRIRRLGEYIRNGYICNCSIRLWPRRILNLGRCRPLTPAVFHVLLALADGERHGYAIMQEVAENTGGRIKMGPGTLYGTIKRLLEARMIEESDERPDPDLDDERRRYYRLTGARPASRPGRGAALRGDGGNGAPQTFDRQASPGGAGGRSPMRQRARRARQQSRSAFRKAL